MIVINEPLLAELGRAVVCGYCRRAMHCHVHHVWAKGLGGGHRLDVRVNLIPLCVWCHRKHHDGNLARQDLILMVAQRENTTYQAIIDVIAWLKRLPKDATEERAMRELRHEAPESAWLARRTWREIVKARTETKETT